MSEVIPSNWNPQERGLAAETERITAVPVVIREVWSAQKCPAGILPWLAWALHVDDWSIASAEVDPVKRETKQRNAIAASIEIHRKKGTATAVRKALQAVGYDAEIDEATGYAYTFRVVLDISERGANEADFTNAENVALENKNARSHLLGVRALLIGRAKARVAAVMLSGEITSVIPPLPKLFQTATAFFVAVAHQAIEAVTVRPPVETNPTLAGASYVSGVVNVEMIYG